MLNPYLADKVRELVLEKKLSQRKVADMTGVSRKVVAEIVRGKWHAKQRRRKKQAEEPRPVGRCPECGVVVSLPCRACHVRRLQAAGKLSPLPGPEDGPPRIELAGAERARYLEVRAAALARGEGDPGPDWEQTAGDDNPWSDDSPWPDVFVPSDDDEQPLPFPPAMRRAG